MTFYDVCGYAFIYILPGNRLGGVGAWAAIYAYDYYKREIRLRFFFLVLFLAVYVFRNLSNDCFLVNIYYMYIINLIILYNIS